jgi:hypothetical protein
MRSPSAPTLPPPPPPPLLPRARAGAGFDGGLSRQSGESFGAYGGGGGVSLAADSIDAQARAIALAQSSRWV